MTYNLSFVNVEQPMECGWIDPNSVLQVFSTFENLDCRDFDGFRFELDLWMYLKRKDNQFFISYQYRYDCIQDPFFHEENSRVFNSESYELSAVYEKRISEKLYKRIMLEWRDRISPNYKVIFDLMYTDKVETAYLSKAEKSLKKDLRKLVKKFVFECKYPVI